MLERIGIVLQECDFPRHLRVAELLSAWRGYYPSPLPLAELLDVVELREERGTLVRRLSGGQRRRLDFALALAGDPDLMFLDEPATGFGLEARRRCWAVIGNLRSLGKTILLTMHQLDEAERLSDRVAILSDGRIQMAGTPRALAREVGAPTRISFSVPERLRRGEIGPPEGTRQAAVASGARAPGGRARRMRLVAHQARLEQRAFWRNPEYAVLTFALPLVLPLVLGATVAGHLQPVTNTREVTLFVPGMLAFGLIVAAYANLASRIALLRLPAVRDPLRSVQHDAGAARMAQPRPGRVPRQGTRRRSPGRVRSWAAAVPGVRPRRPGRLDADRPRARPLFLPLAALTPAAR
jgi:hypothetical protein